MLHLVIEEDGEDILGTVSGKGTGDMDVWESVFDIVVTQFTGEKNHIAVVLAVRVDPVDVRKFIVNVFVEFAAEIMLLDDLADGFQGAAGADNGHGDHNLCPFFPKKG